ncbi:MAG: four helix bundle protein [Chloroflexia bacterium]
MVWRGRCSTPQFQSAEHCRGLRAQSHSEFHQFLSIAKGSCAELRAQLYVAADVGYLTQEQSTVLLFQAEEVAVGGLRAKVAQRRDDREERR